MKKNELRKIYKEKRKALSLDQMEKMNDLILINFQKIALPFINCVHTYLASLKLAEADAAKVVRFLQFKNPELKVVVPKIDVRSGNIDHLHFNDTSELIENAFDEDATQVLITILSNG